MQGEPELGSMSVVAPPYRTHRMMGKFSKVRLSVKLHFTEAADFDKRSAGTEYLVDLPHGEVDLQSSTSEAAFAGLVSPTHSKATVSRSGRLVRSRGRHEVADTVQSNASAGPEWMQQTVVQYVTQELAYDLPIISGMKVESGVFAPVAVQTGKRKRTPVTHVVLGP